MSAIVTAAAGEGARQAPDAGWEEPEAAHLIVAGVRGSWLNLT
jgi:hypothetical protein